MLLRLWVLLKNSLLLGPNILLALLSLLAYLAAFCSPALWSWPSFLALAFPYMLLGHLLCIIYWLWRKKRAVYISLASLLIGIMPLKHSFGLPFRWQELPPDNIRCMSYNVQYFGVTHLPKEQQEGHQQGILDYILAQRPKILCGQEFSGANKGATTQKALNYLKAGGLQHSKTGGASSLFIASAYPIRETGLLSFPASHNAALFADIELPQKQIIRVYSLHLQSIGLGAEADEVFKKENIQQIDDAKMRSKYRKIGSKIRRAMVQRADQVQILAEHIQKSPYPVLLLGDFNDLPLSYSLGRMRSLGLSDSFAERGKGWGSTYSGNIPFLRIDYALASPEFRVHKHQVLHKNYSDHYPLLVDYSLKKK